MPNLILFAVPVFLAGYVLIWIFSIQLRWLPVQGYKPLAQGFWPCIQSLILPAIALGTTYMALIARITRASMLEVLSQDYIRTANSKGLATDRVLLLHALKNAAVPLYSAGFLPAITHRLAPPITVFCGAPVTSG